MSRGLGRVERTVLAALDGQEQTLTWLAEHLYGDRADATPAPVSPAIAAAAAEFAALLGVAGTGRTTEPDPATESELVSLRRAVRSLRRKGLVTTDQRWRPLPGRDRAGYVRYERVYLITPVDPVSSAC